MIAGLTAAVCFEVCVCVVHAQILTHTCTGIYTCTHHPGNEAVCLPCITNHTQVWQAMKRLSTFNMQLEIFFFFPFPRPCVPHYPPPPPDDQIICLTESHVWNVRPHLPLSVCWRPRLNMSTAGCPWKVSQGCLKPVFFFPKTLQLFCMLQCQMSCSGDYINYQ